jgi:hypothetical protein
MPSDIVSHNPKGSATASRRFYLWIRDLHLYLGLFVSPFVLIFAVSTLFLNHAWKPWNEDDPQNRGEKWTATIEVPDGLGSLSHAQDVMRQLRLSGEIDFISYLPAEHRLEFPVNKPGQRMVISVDLHAKTTTIERRRTSLWEALIYLHKSPGPHNAKIRGNWFFTRLWAGFSDATVYALLFLSVGGIYLWAVIEAERKTGLFLIGAGMAAFLMISAALSLRG